MAGDVTTEYREFILALLRQEGPIQADELVERLTQQFENVDEERAGEIIWALIDGHTLRVTEEAELDSSDAVAG